MAYSAPPDAAKTRATVGGPSPIEIQSMSVSTNEQYKSLLSFVSANNVACVPAMLTTPLACPIGVQSAFASTGYRRHKRLSSVMTYSLLSAAHIAVTLFA